MLNQFSPNEEIIVQNYGFYIGNDNLFDSSEIIKILNSLPTSTGDIVIMQGFKIPSIDFIEVIDISNRPHNYGDLFFDEGHHTPEGNFAYAARIFQHLQKNNFYNDKYIEQTKSQLETRTLQNNLNLSAEVAEKLTEYKQTLTDFYNANFPRPKIGSIVMNCNPFTLGHRYLIETAASQVDVLVVFVVQEDISVFPFDDRLELIDKETADIENLAVIPSGQFIISSLTFTEYFNKSELQDRTIDCSIDVNLFGQEIAPCLDIKVRFVGEEPFDQVTRQYNESMKAILPRYGIEVIEIPRKEYGGEAISASRVRKLLENKDWVEIEKLVPETTLEYLKNKFEQ
uniref:[citrate [pro-3S]-lyase] ligase n=1 Tax=uncultured bacterium contig00107 TaxID=1181573 RepID=A0A806K2V3_9BACT|nr:[citrate [pro-3S]-lyase] ligase [uncultured bacterium contig00107]